MEKNIKAELFEFVPRADTPEVPTSPGSYSSFGKALSKFIRRPLAIVPLAVIALIVLFSILVPVFVTRPPTYMDPYYAKKGPRSAWLSENVGIMHGEATRSFGEAGMISLYAIGIGAYDKTGEGVAPNTDMSGYSPLISFTKSGDRYRAVVDSYLEVGFIYMTVTEGEYLEMLEYEKNTGVELLYPLIAENEYSPARPDANIWYRTDSRGRAIDENGDLLDFSDDIALVDNYLRNEAGEPIYSVYSGGGSLESAGRKVRTLYYNYYLYKNGTRPDYIMGTDSQGYDLAQRLAGGVRLSLLIALAVSLINLTLGALVGAVEGYYGGVVDLSLERITDVLSGVPFIVVATLFQIHLASSVGAIPSLLFAFVLTGWIGTAKRVRAQFYRFKNSEYVLAARTLGASDGRIIWRHIFPNTLGTLITASALVIPGVIFSESMLSFLGIVNLGGSEMTSLGTLLSEAGSIWTSFPHLIFYPALFVSLLMISFNLLGNQLREALA